MRHATPAAERVGLDPLDAAINTGVNHPAKMAMLLAMATRPDHAFSTIELRQDLHAMSSDWQEYFGANVQYHCTNGLVLAGLVEVGTKKAKSGDTVTASWISERGLSWGVPLFGAILDLELTTEFSSQLTFGGTNSSATEHDDMRAPLTRMQILEHMHSAKDRPVSLQQIRDHIPRSIGAVDTSVKALESAGLLVVRHKTNPAHRTLEITEPNLSRIQRTTSRMRPEARAVHDTAVRLYNSKRWELDGESFIGTVLEKYPDLSRESVWSIVVDFTPHCMRFSDAAYFGGNNGKRAPRTRIEIEPKSQAVVEALVSRVQAIRTSSDFRTIAALRAMQIINDRDAVTYVLGKAQSNSWAVTQEVRNLAIARTSRLAARLAGRLGLQRLLTVESDWHHKAACRGMDPELFFGIAEHLSEKEAALARVVCNGCVVQLSCLQQAVARSEPYGMWGGITELGRRNLPPSKRGNAQSFKN